MHQRPRNFGEPTWEAESETETTTGSAETSASPDPSFPLAVLWLPDPEARRGWREHYVARRQEQRPRPFGYRKR